MKKTTIATCLVVFVAALAGCGGSSSSQASKNFSGKAPAKVEVVKNNDLILVEKSNEVGFGDYTSFQAVELSYKGKHVVCLVGSVYEGGAPVCPDALQPHAAPSAP
jgi:hypothetical protein